MVKDRQTWMDVRSLIGGWNTYDDPSNIADIELVDINNMIYDGGILQLRQGISLLYEKPDGETGEPLQLIVPKTSDGVEYLIAIYANHFYLRHDVNDEWLRINQTFVPVETERYFGNTNWNNGRSDDRLYGCNGVDDFFRWDMCVSTVNGAATAGATTITIDDATRFPSSGTIVIKGVSSTFEEPYTSKTGNQLNLTNTLNENVSDGASIACAVLQKASMEVGKIVSKFSGRLITANYYGGETTIWYSVTSSPEDFTTGSNVTDASTIVISDGNGEITGFHDFGEFGVIEKEDSFHRFDIKVSSDLGSKLDNIVPIGSGASIGPISYQSTVKIDNKLMYPSRLNGFISVDPTISGGQSSIQKTFLSQKIHNFVSRLNYDVCRSVVFENKVLWSVALPGSDIPIAILVYDNLRGSWTKIENKSVVDFATKDKQVLFLERGTGNIYRLFDESYNDNNDYYSAYFLSKRYDYGVLAVPKVNDKVYIQGYMTQSSEFFIDVLFNEAGSLGQQTFRINTSTDGVLVSNPVIGSEMGAFLLGNIEMGGVQLSHVGGVVFFRCYLSVSNRLGFYNLQLKGYSSKEAFWAITGISFNPEQSADIPNTMVVSPINEIEE